MKYFQPMQRLQPLDDLSQSTANLYEYAPNGILREVGTCLLLLLYLLEEVAIVHVLHHYAQVVRFNEGLFEGDDVLTSHGCKDAYFGECVLLLFFGEGHHAYFLECVLLTVGKPANDIDAGVCTFPCVSSGVPNFERIWKFFSAIGK